MRQYNDLTKSGKLRRLRGLAVTALDRYGLSGASLRFHQFETNLLYRVQASDGERYMLRLATPGWRTLQDLESEAMWLAALALDTDIPAPRIVRSNDGQSVIRVGGPGVPMQWNATLMTWLPGQLLGKRLDAFNILKMGELFGHMHAHGKEWQPPGGFTTRVFDRFLSRDEPNVIVANEQLDAYGPGVADILGRLMDRVDRAYAALDRKDLRVIHCDLWHDNIKLHRSRLCPFDFEDTVWGFRIHDIAMAMLDLLEDTDDDRYAIFLPVFRAGYEKVLPWPDGDMEIFQIGRLLWKINWVARFERAWLPQMADRHLPVFQEYETTGRLTMTAQAQQ